MSRLMGGLAESSPEAEAGVTFGLLAPVKEGRK